MLPFAELVTACENDSASTESAKRLVLTWINYSSADELQPDGEEYNEMHAFGFGLAYMLSKYDALQIRERRWEDLPAALAAQGCSVHEYSCEQCLLFLRVLQAEYSSVLQFDASVGYEADVDMTLLLLVVMQRLGDHLREQVRMTPEQAEKQAVYEIVRGQTEWYVVDVKTRIECFDVLHVLMRLFFVLLDAQPVHVDAEVVTEYLQEFSPFQHEASLHDFYNLSMVMDCKPASIILYKHTYREMFNDASQCVYFHTPTYKRPRQIDFEGIVSMAARDVNVLPIIAQIKPDVPILFEHTGACSSSACSAESWSWLVIHKHIVLCDSNGKYYVAKNIYILFAYLMSKCDE
jgi:hypothetical protein